MPEILKQLLRATVIGLALGGGVFWWIRAHTDNSRIGEVRRRVTPSLKRELRSAGFTLGDALFIRVFKETRELELWLRPKQATTYGLWKTFPIAGMSGNIGPKLAEGDYQSPEGFYEVNQAALNPESDCHLSFNIGFPNNFDASLGRTGSWIMVHGSNCSVGCLAMTDPVIEQIYLIAEAALKNGQPAFAVHTFPFRMTEKRMREAAESEWLPFWENLRTGYLMFEANHIPPTVRPGVGQYEFEVAANVGRL